MRAYPHQPNPIWGLLFLAGFVAFITLLLFVFEPRQKETAVAKLRTTNTFNIGVLSQRTNQQLAHKSASVTIVEALAARYGWQPQYLAYNSVSELLHALKQGEVDTIADMVIDHRIDHQVRFSHAYDRGNPVLVYFPNVTEKVTSLDNMPANSMLVINESWQERYLQREKLVYEQLSWQELPEFFSLPGLIESISKPPGGYTLVLEREYLPLSYNSTSLRRLTHLTPVDLGFAFRAEDASLSILVSAFIQNWQKETARSNIATRAALQPRITRTDLKVFLGMISKRLPKYREIFINAGKTHNLDWRLIAAIAYQESLWNASAVSPTGVRGLMMLTESTAASLGVKDRTDPHESVFGGTKYFLLLRNRMPERITEPDRSWFALAAYNVGFAHLKDVQLYTKKRGKNQDSWEDVKGYMHLLEDPSWYPDSRYGYARGNEAKLYVANIRKYFEVLLHLPDSNAQDADVSQSGTIQVGSKLPTLTLPDRIVQKY